MHTLRASLALLLGALVALPALLPADASTQPLPDLPPPRVASAPPRDGAYGLVLERTNFDGSVWAVYAYAPGMVPATDLRGLAADLADAGVHAYGRQVLRNPICGSGNNTAVNWGFESKDSDCVLRIYMPEQPSADVQNGLPCAAACAPPGLEVVVVYQPWAREVFLATGSDVNATQAEFMQAVVGHELFHSLQYVIAQHDPYWQAYVEGQAAFQETIVAPSVAADPGSTWYARGRDYQRSAVSGICHDGPVWGADVSIAGVPLWPRSYTLGLYWGYLYWKDGGFDMIRRTLDAVKDARGLTCDDGLPQAITAALAASSGLHDTHEAALADFALHAYTKDFTWGGPDGLGVQNWGEHLADPLFEIQPAGSIPRTIGPSGIQYVKLPTVGAYEVECTAGSGWTFRLFLKAPAGAVTTQDVSCGTPVAVDGSLHAEVVFTAVRTATTEGTYTLTVA